VRTMRVLISVVLIAGCGGGAPASPTSIAASTPTASPAPTASPTPVASRAIQSASPRATQVALPTGRVLFYRLTAGNIEEYFTIKTDGTEEQALFTAEGCGCAHFSPDGTSVWTMGPTEHGTWSFSTMRHDGSQREVISPPIETLSLAQPVATADGQRIAFAGWDDTDPSRDGLYIASPDLTDLTFVMATPPGTVAVEPFAVTPDGSRVLFFNETGPFEGTTHAGDLFVVDSDGTNLRRLNPAGTKVGFVDWPVGSLSPDGRQVAFGVDDDVFVADLGGGEARRLTNNPGYVWAVSWSPTGEWITYTRQYGTTSVVSLVRPDGSDDHEISPNDPSAEAAAAVWSPDGAYLLVQRADATNPAGGRNLWIMDLAGSYIGQVTHEPADYGQYSWAPIQP